MIKSFEETYPTLHDYVREKFQNVSGVPFVDGAHIRQVCAALDKVVLGETTRLIITMPPRYGHTTLVSVLFPSYYLGVHSARHVIAAASDFRAAKCAEKSVHQLTHADFEGKTLAGGSHYACGVGDPLAGRPADLVVADNLSDGREALIALARPEIYKLTYQWYASCLLRRLNPDGAAVSTHVRYGAEDVTGRMLKAYPDATVVQIVGLADNDESTWPNFWPTKVLHGLRRRLGGFSWDAQYQQNPHTV